MNRRPISNDAMVLIEYAMMWLEKAKLTGGCFKTGLAPAFGWKTPVKLQSMLVPVPVLKLLLSKKHFGESDPGSGIGFCGN